MGRKLALIIGNSRYDDPGLARLTTADVDVRELAEVLRTPDIGEFDEVVELPDEGLAAVRRSIAQFFGQAKKDDLLVFYFSGHGVKDENGHLYLAVRDTELRLLAGTSVEAAFITTQMDRSYSKRQVLILDCCHSGAFAYGTKSADAQAVGTAPAFEGTGFGRVVLTATDSTQYAWQGDQIIGESDKSVFTHYLLEGLKTGEADRDGDGLITIDELYDYVYEHVVSETPKQTPGKWSYKQQGDIVLARNPRPFARTAELPLEVRALLESPLARLRTEAVPELAALLQGRHRGVALGARRALEDLRGDDSRRVSAAAEAVLATLQQQEEAEAAAALEAERARHEAERLLAEASERLALQDLSGALSQVDAARELDPSSTDAIVLRDEIQHAIEEAHQREELEREVNERREKVSALIGKADQTGSHEAAIEALKAALELDPGHEAAEQLLARHTAALEQLAAEEARQQRIAAARRRIEVLLQKDELNEAEQEIAQFERDSGGGDLSALEEPRRRLREKLHDRVAAGAIERARREFTAGHQDAAVAALERFHPPHPLVSRALAELSTDLARLERHEQQRKRKEAERLAREQEVASLLDTARSCIERQQFVEALGALRRVRQLDPEVGLTELVEAAEAGRVAAEEAGRRRHESEGVLAKALKRYRKRDFAQALMLADEACRLDPDNSAVSGMRDEIRQALSDRTAAAGSAGLARQARVTLGDVPAILRSRPWHVGIVAVVLLSILVLFSFSRRDGRPFGQSESSHRSIGSGRDVPLAPDVVVPSVQPETVPAVVQSPVLEHSKPVAPRAGRPLTPAPSGLEIRIALLLADGDKFIEARNYDGALSAYEEAGRLGSAVGRERAEKVGQVRAAQVRVRLNRAERLQGTGEYDEALRVVDDALTLDPKSGEARRLRQRVLDAQRFERGPRPGGK